MQKIKVYFIVFLVALFISKNINPNVNDLADALTSIDASIAEAKKQTEETQKKKISELKRLLTFSQDKCINALKAFAKKYKGLPDLKDTTLELTTNEKIKLQVFLRRLDSFGFNWDKDDDDE